MMHGQNDKSENNSTNEMKLFLEKIRNQVEKSTKRESKPSFPEEGKIIIKGENFKYEIEELINQNILL